MVVKFSFSITRCLQQIRIIKDYEIQNIDDLKYQAKYNKKFSAKLPLKYSYCFKFEDPEYIKLPLSESRQLEILKLFIQKPPFINQVSNLRFKSAGLMRNDDIQIYFNNSLVSKYRVSQSIQD